jgi:hypothetical protein
VTISFAGPGATLAEVVDQRSDRRLAGDAEDRGEHEQAGASHDCFDSSAGVSGSS